jgi:hypothetical protein
MGTLIMEIYAMDDVKNICWMLLAKEQDVITSPVVSWISPSAEGNVSDAATTDNMESRRWAKLKHRDTFAYERAE